MIVAVNVLHETWDTLHAAQLTTATMALHCECECLCPRALVSFSLFIPIRPTIYLHNMLMIYPIAWRYLPAFVRLVFREGPIYRSTVCYMFAHTVHDTYSTILYYFIWVLICDQNAVIDQHTMLLRYTHKMMLIYYMWRVGMSLCVRLLARSLCNVYIIHAHAIKHGRINRHDTKTATVEASLFCFIFIIL